MALKLESEIMARIGLGNHYQWFNGSTSCAAYRNSAVAKLKKAIQAAHDDGKHICPPQDDLIDLARRARGLDQSDCTLTKTWQACSHVIAIHIHLHGLYKKRQQQGGKKAFGEMKADYLKSIAESMGLPNGPPKPRVSMDGTTIFYDDGWGGYCG